jgi:hypothetical protein
MLVDSDLWMLQPEARYAIEEEKAVAVWREAADKLGALVYMAINEDLFGNDAITQCLGDAQARAQEALRRTKERAREAS